MKGIVLCMAVAAYGTGIVITFILLLGANLPAEDTAKAITIDVVAALAWPVYWPVRTFDPSFDS